MVPLAWHVYSGNYDIVKLLLDNGAEINLDFDLDESGRKGTALDVSTLLTKNKDEQVGGRDALFVRVHKLLIERGGKAFNELNEL